MKEKEEEEEKEGEGEAVSSLLAGTKGLEVFKTAAGWGLNCSASRCPHDSSSPYDDHSTHLSSLLSSLLWMAGGISAPPPQTAAMGEPGEAPWSDQRSPSHG